MEFNGSYDAGPGLWTLELYSVLLSFPKLLKINFNHCLHVATMVVKAGNDCLYLTLKAAAVWFVNMRIAFSVIGYFFPFQITDWNSCIQFLYFVIG